MLGFPIGRGIEEEEEEEDGACAGVINDPNNQNNPKYVQKIPGTEYAPGATECAPLISTINGCALKICISLELF
jgi:hypothetical protein